MSSTDHGDETATDNARKPVELTDNSNNSTRDYCTTPEVVFNYDMNSAPRGQKMLLLTEYKIAVMGKLSAGVNADPDIIAWFPLPVRDKKKEEELGL